MLAKRLTDHVLGKVEMSQTQIKAVDILLKKSLPDLSSVDTTIRGDPAAPIQITSTDGQL